MKNQSRIFVCIFFLFSIVLHAQEYSPYYYHKKDLFERLPNTKNEIVFLGNSITDGGEWSEMFQDLRIKNRGISGDITDGVMLRLKEVTESKPAKIFIMIGVNDLAQGKTAQQILLNYETIIKSIKDDSPATEIFVESVLPVNSSFKQFSKHVNKGSKIIELNKDLATVSAIHGANYIDLHSAFLDANGQLDKKYTIDGLHLNGAGYMLWKSLIEKYID